MADETMTTEELEARARDLEISGRSSMNKAELIDAINAAEGTEGADEPGTGETDESVAPADRRFDPIDRADDQRDRTPRLPDAMAQARDAERERLAAQDAAVEERPGASLPDELAQVRDQTREAEGATAARSVRDTPETG